MATAIINVHILSRQVHAVNGHLYGRQQVNDHPWPPTPTQLQQVEEAWDSWEEGWSKESLCKTFTSDLQRPAYETPLVHHQRTCWGRVEELLVAGELWIDHKKLIFFLFSSASACTNHPLGVDQRRVRDPRRVSSIKAARHESSQLSHSTVMARNQWQAMQEIVAGLTQALQNVVQAGNQAAAARNGAGDLHRNFRSLNPPRFSRSPDPDEAENWQEEIERIFQVMQFSRLNWWDFVCPCGRVVCFASRALRALPDGGLMTIVCLLPLLSVGYSGWWCFHMAFGAVSHTVVTIVAKVPPLELF
ncbi:hypothetical protein Taro_000640 [Colocasia esculenta]|uniref:Uncharacterized protein n=1 Tax=Colocasia esculenta TaxID=4460 RepID=A0A843T7R3_COLES|nr:hypothetical protein [Colocasia esculenta]